MKRSGYGLNELNSATVIVVIIGASLSIFINSLSWSKYLTYVLPLVAGLAVLILVWDRITPKINAFLYASIAVVSIFFGDHGNLSGAFFACCAYSMYENRRFLIALIVACAVATIIKFSVSGFYVTQALLYVVGMTYAFMASYLIFIRPKNTIVISSEADDYELLEVVRLWLMGLSYDQIADRFDVTASAIQKRLERARGRMGAKSNGHLAVILSQKGLLTVN